MYEPMLIQRIESKPKFPTLRHMQSEENIDMAPIVSDEEDLKNKKKQEEGLL